MLRPLRSAVLSSAILALALPILAAEPETLEVRKAIGRIELSDPAGT